VLVRGVIWPRMGVWRVAGLSCHGGLLMGV
jgi:hypothetical protein